ncbi:MAG: cytochrome c [Alphaproteobacteria bacterium]|jgi:S-disulfanyl-L-cysteine oxidoreductase SoxD|nr:cytochrome c [Alphaproteobacteria bacterium]MBT5860048.1 cytochrome c [Alphaproteobacteria bacterium]
MNSRTFLPRPRRFWAIAVAVLWILGVPTVGQAQETVLDGAFTEEQAARGKVVASTICSACHGASLGGGGFAPAIVGRSFQRKWAPGTLADPFAFISSRMPRNNPGGLTDQQYADALSFLLQTTGYPAGTTELVPDADVLRGIRLEALP